MTIKDTEQILKDVTRNYKSRDNESIKDNLALLKEKALNNNKNEEAKHIWCLETILSAQRYYTEAYSLFIEEKYYDGWCKLEQAEHSCAFLERHFSDEDNLYQISFMKSHIPKLQSLFPYKVFISPEFIGRARCSICNEIISPRKKCSHKLGDIYRGEMVGRKLEQLEFLGMALVRNPVQKYSVAFTGKDDPNSYLLVKYYIDCIQSPFDRWEYTETRKLYPHSFFSDVKHSDKCPCQSGEIYSECCLKNEEGVKMPHFQFQFAKVKESAPLANQLILDKQDN